MISKEIFNVENISNCPNDFNKIERLLEIFKDKKISINTLLSIENADAYGCKISTFRKVVNHASIIGMLDRDKINYSLSDLSQKYFNGQMGRLDYMQELIDSSKILKNNFMVIECLLNLFNNELDIKTIYLIFSYVASNRLDESSMASFGRNIRSYLALYKMGGLVEKRNNKINLLNDKKELCVNKKFSTVVINVNDLRRYVNEFFEEDVTEKILKCIATYENDKYIWVKSSINKDKGEIVNLNQERIATFMIKE